MPNRRSRDRQQRPVRCSSCGGTFQPRPGRPRRMLKCPLCGAEIELERVERAERLARRSGADARLAPTFRFLLSLPVLLCLVLLMAVLAVSIAMAAGASIGIAMAIGGILGAVLGGLVVIFVNVLD